VVFEGRVIQLCSVQSSPASPAYDDAHAIERRRVKMRSFDEVVEAAAGFVTVVAAVPGRWVQNPDSHLRVLTIEAFLSERYAAVAALVNPGECAQAGGVIIDGCSAAEFRAMRLSSRGLPPPLPGTVFWVDDFGLIERVEAPGS
jgi:hypothetical protein